METVRKQQSVAAIMARVSMQINAKFLGPLWHVDLHSREAYNTMPMMQEPCMVVGIDLNYCKSDGMYCLGFCASKDMNVSMYYSNAVPIHKAGSMAIRLKVSLAF